MRVRVPPFAPISSRSFPFTAFRVRISAAGSRCAHARKAPQVRVPPFAPSSSRSFPFTRQPGPSPKGHLRVAASGPSNRNALRTERCRRCFGVLKRAQRIVQTVENQRGRNGFRQVMAVKIRQGVGRHPGESQGDAVFAQSLAEPRDDARCGVVDMGDGFGIDDDPSHRGTAAGRPGSSTSSAN